MTPLTLFVGSISIETGVVMFYKQYFNDIKCWVQKSVMIGQLIYSVRLSHGGYLLRKICHGLHFRQAFFFFKKQVNVPILAKALAIVSYQGGVLRLELDRGVPLKLQNPYPSLRAILTKKGTHF